MAQENPFQPEYRKLKESEEVQIENIKKSAQDLLLFFPVGRRESVYAQARLEEAVMWAVKAVTAP